MTVPDKKTISLFEDEHEVEVRITALKTEEEVIASDAINAKSALSKIFAELNIRRVYYIDDSFGYKTNDLDEFLAQLTQISTDKQKKIKIKEINFGVIPEGQLSDTIREKWSGLDFEKQLSLVKQVFNESTEPTFSQDLKDVSLIDSYFPESVTLTKLNPIVWDEQRDKIINEIPEGEKILLLFDEDLKQARGRFENTKGINLIQEVNGHAKAPSIVCCLLTWMINKAESETAARKGLCETFGIDKRLFLPLSKERNKNQTLFSDGLKKALLNTYCENIKDATKELLINANKAAIEDFEEIDTYSFDNIILKSSYEEGVGEKDTLLRIYKVLLDAAAKKLMGDHGFLGKINSEIISAKRVSDLVIDVRPNIQPNKGPFRIRHNELYEDDQTINKLCEPINNGDIFEITVSDKTEHFILVSQACDLMVRTDRAKEGRRTATFALLLRVSQKTISRLNKEVKSFYSSPKPTHFFAAKFKLPYYKIETSDVGIVEFENGILIDIDVLDLAVYNHEGVCKLDLTKPNVIPKEMIQPWIARHQHLVKKFEDIKEEYEKYSGVLAALEEILPSNEIIPFWQKTLPEFSFLRKIGNPNFYNKGAFDFGIKRIRRLREPESIRLLNRYMRHLSRDAEEHDFVKRVD